MMPKRFSKIHLRRSYKQFYPLVKDKKTASYLTLTLSLFTLSFFGLFAIRPTLITATSLIKKVSDLKKLNIEYENKINSIIRAQFEYEQIRNRLSLINEALPEQSSFTKLAQGLEKFGQASNVTINQLHIDDVSVSSPLLDRKLLQYGFNVIATGDYPSLTSYISHFTNWTRIATLSKLEFTRDGSGTISSTLRLHLSGKTYYEP